MANAKKCDRCGKLYEAPICNDIVKITVDYGPYSDNRFDLCDSCYRELCDWTGLDGDLERRKRDES